ncbi:hypothetical protein Rhopal_000347-T1 [Rhodotorula paludigena]|uniref:Uncharacterized protein n=1 Tax=Rhodotorula paludigena TaxID=86838 RepID=A0AAV5GFI4_9BASI|nr:hypothetical protein Rhopal_000347-T1 [Rhodotorula paludigena]
MPRYYGPPQPKATAQSTVAQGVVVSSAALALLLRAEKATQAKLAALQTSVEGGAAGQASTESWSFVAVEVRRDAFAEACEEAFRPMWNCKGTKSEFRGMGRDLAWSGCPIRMHRIEIGDEDDDDRKSAWTVEAFLQDRAELEDPDPEEKNPYEEPLCAQCFKKYAVLAQEGLHGVSIGALKPILEPFGLHILPPAHRKFDRKCCPLVLSHKPAASRWAENSSDAWSSISSERNGLLHDGDALVSLLELDPKALSPPLAVDQWKYRRFFEQYSGLWASFDLASAPLKFEQTGEAPQPKVILRQEVLLDKGGEGYW